MASVYPVVNIQNRCSEKDPYGVIHFDKIASENFYFVDRTSYIVQMEQLAEP